MRDKTSKTTPQKTNIGQRGKNPTIGFVRGSQPETPSAHSITSRATIQENKAKGKTDNPVHARKHECPSLSFLSSCPLNKTLNTACQETSQLNMREETIMMGLSIREMFQKMGLWNPYAHKVLTQKNHEEYEGHHAGVSGCSKSNPTYRKARRLKNRAARKARMIRAQRAA